MNHVHGGNAEMTRTGRRSSAGVLVLSAVLAVAGCGNSASSPRSDAPTTDPVPGLATAPDSARIDLGEPTFFDPTTITNPLFPITAQNQVVQVGTEGDTALRHEITLLPEIKTIEWEGQQIETVVSQFVAYGDGRILEVARDFFAQADDGSVWYFGEDVANYVDGLLDNTDGTWLAGRDGPPGMIMPADPRVGDVYRPENIPDLVFEEVTVKSVNEIVDGPQGPITGALLVEELLMDGVTEDKIFAPGYGEFLAGVVSEDELVTVSVGVPLDAVDGSAPAAMDAMSAGVGDLNVAAADRNLSAARTALGTVAAAWEDYRTPDVPPLTAEQMDQALTTLRSAVDGRASQEVQLASFEVALVTLDLRMRHAPTATVDLGRLDVFSQRVLVDAERSDAGAIAGDVVALQAIMDRLAHTLDGPTRSEIQSSLDELRSAGEAEDLSAATSIASRLQEELRA